MTVAAAVLNPQPQGTGQKRDPSETLSLAFVVAMAVYVFCFIIFFYAKMGYIAMSQIMQAGVTRALLEIFVCVTYVGIAGLMTVGDSPGRCTRFIINSAGIQILGALYAYCTLSLL